MRQRVDARLLDEIRVRGLRFTCTDCLYHLPGAGGDGEGSCAHGWPHAEHRHAPDATAVTDGKHLVFCKEFDLR